MTTKERAPMTAGQLAALIAAGFFALLACVACVVLLRLGRLIGAATELMTGYRQRADTLIEQAQAVVDRTSEQLTRTDAITASMDEVTANMAELTGHVSALTGLARALSSAVGAPVTGISAVAYGVRRAVALRRPEQEPAPHRADPRPAEAVPQQRRPPALAGSVSRRGAALSGLRSEERATREDSALKRPGGERKQQSSGGRR
jgi:Bacterial protein of unknown function (DUF948)